MEVEWEEIFCSNDGTYERTFRMYVPGGWLVRHVIEYPSRRDSDYYDRTIQTCNFVSDPDHEWNVD